MAVGVEDVAADGVEPVAVVVTPARRANACYVLAGGGPSDWRSKG